jgi:ribosomal protein L40E
MWYLLLSVLVVIIVGTIAFQNIEGVSDLDLVDRWGVKYCNDYAVHYCMAEKQEIGKSVEFRQPVFIVIDSNDFAYVHHYSRGDTHDILKISKDGKLVDIWKDISDSFARMEINSKDEIFLADFDNIGTFLKLDPNGRISETWNLSDMGFTHVDVEEVFIDNQDNLYFSERKLADNSGIYHEWENTVKKFALDGTLLKTFENMAAPLAQDSEGNLYGKGKCEIIKYDESGKKLFSFGKCNKPGQTWGTPFDIVIDSNDFVYASYTSNGPNPVWIFNNEGKLIGNTPYGTSSSKIDAKTVLKKPMGLALDSEDNLFVVDRMKHSVFKFSEIPITVQPMEPVAKSEIPDEKTGGTLSVPATKYEGGIMYESCGLVRGNPCWVETDESYNQRVIQPMIYTLVLTIIIIGVIVSIIVVVIKRKRSKTPKPSKQKTTKEKETLEFCIQCGAELKPEAKFCAKCGNQA